MQAEEIRLGDISRLLFGEASASFAIEVILRLVFLYAVLAVALRMMGRRVASQLTRTELISLVALAAAVGPAVATPDQGLLPPVIVAAWVVLMQRWIGIWTLRHPRFEHLVQGEAATLVSDGRMDLRALRRNSISRDTLYAALRSAGVTQLGAVERVYLESHGSFTTLLANPERPGLSIIPDWDTDFHAAQRATGERVCERCGAARGSQAGVRCPSCGGTSWVPALPS
jgi:uncharacterized membrane protein YcaP (DUF421 family)